jgi:DNA-binding MarR family transcriptional regulator
VSHEGRVAETVKLLDNVESNGTANQRFLAHEIGVSIGLANALVRRAVKKGLIKMKQAPARRYIYYLTPKGLTEKSRLVAEYLDFSLTFFRAARNEYNELFTRCARQGQKRVVLCGVGELAEIATLAAIGSGVEIVAIYDLETNQSHYAGLPILRDLAELPPESVSAVTDGRRAQATFDLLVSTWGRDRILCPKFLRVSQNVADRSNGDGR